MPSLRGFQSARCAHVSLPSNMAARLLYKARRSCHGLPLLKERRRLPIEKRIEEYILTMAFKARNGIAPSYLAELLRDYTPVRTLRSSDNHTLAVPPFKLKTEGDRSFCASGQELGTLFHLLFVRVPLLVLMLLLALSLPCYLLATHSDGCLPEYSSLPATHVARSLKKRADSPPGSLLL